jgi:D-beta-D-heptose 7-phosphate kinase/D-beta-D-heptose 1-phosphate adenosyltransferase
MVIAISGGFDPIHIGHINLFKEASQYGDLYVIVNSDDWLIRKKGKYFMSFAERKQIIESIKYVKKVILAKDDDNSVCETLKQLKPNYFANGGDRLANNTPELNLCLELKIKPLFNIGGGKIQSSSELLANYEKSL